MAGGSKEYKIFINSTVSIPISSVVGKEHVSRGAGAQNEQGGVAGGFGEYNCDSQYRKYPTQLCSGQGACKQGDWSTE
jgi:hypothetical protein